MAWYYYSGNTSRPVEVDKNKTKSVKPHSKINIIQMGPMGRALLNKKLLARTGKPAVVREDVVVENEELTMADVVKVSPWAKAVSESGSVGSAAEIIDKIKTDSPNVKIDTVTEEQNGQNTVIDDTINSDDDTVKSEGKKKRKLRHRV